MIGAVVGIETGTGIGAVADAVADTGIGPVAGTGIGAAGSSLNKAAAARNKS